MGERPARKLPPISGEQTLNGFPWRPAAQRSTCAARAAGLGFFSLWSAGVGGPKPPGPRLTPPPSVGVGVGHE